MVLSALAERKREARPKAQKVSAETKWKCVSVCS